jgi:hypothetical protein
VRRRKLAVPHKLIAGLGVDIGVALQIVVGFFALGRIGQILLGQVALKDLAVAIAGKAVVLLFHVHELPKLDGKPCYRNLTRRVA